MVWTPAVWRSDAGSPSIAMNDLTNFDVEFESVRDGVVSMQVRFDGIVREEAAFSSEHEDVERLRASLAEALTRSAALAAGAPGRDGAFTASGPEARVEGDGAGRAASPRQTGDEFGAWLFRRFVHGQAYGKWCVARDRAKRDGGGVRLRLVFSRETAGLATLPWELLLDRSGGELPLALVRSSPVVRMFEVPSGPKKPVLDGALRILLVAFDDGGTLDLAAERSRIEAVLGPLLADGRVELEQLDPPTLNGLTERLRDRGKPVHVLHFLGHGDFDEATGQSYLLLQDPKGGVHPVPSTALAAELEASGTASLVVLNSCEGAKGDTRYVFSSAAGQLTAAGVNAVVAMSHKISDAAAVAFAADFYAALAEDDRVDDAVHAGRSAVHARFPTSVEWATPALFLRSEDGRLFTPPKPSSGPAMGEMVTKVCDRRRQARQFTDFIEDAERARDGMPRICVVPSLREERPDSLVERLIATSLEEVANRLNSEAGMGGRSVMAPWPAGGEGSAEDMRADCIFEMEESADRILPGGRPRPRTAVEFVEHPAFVDRPIVAVEHDLLVAEWGRDSADFASWYVKEFWGSLEPDPRRPLFVVFLRVIYPVASDPAPSDGLGSLLRRFKRGRTVAPESVVEELRTALGAGSGAGVPTLVLDALEPIRISDVELWWKSHDIRGDLFTDQEIKALFPTDDAVVPMVEIEPVLERVYAAHRRAYSKELGQDYFQQ